MYWYESLLCGQSDHDFQHQMSAGVLSEKLLQTEVYPDCKVYYIRANKVTGLFNPHNF